MYGWKLEEDKLTPAIGYNQVCPPSILKILSSSCKAGNSGSKSCGCNSMGLTSSEIYKCSDACINGLDESNPNEDGIQDLED